MDLGFLERVFILGYVCPRCGERGAHLLVSRESFGSVGPRAIREDDGELVCEACAGRDDPVRYLGDAVTFTTDVRPACRRCAPDDARIHLRVRIGPSGTASEVLAVFGGGRGFDFYLDAEDSWLGFGHHPGCLEGGPDPNAFVLRGEPGVWTPHE